MQTQTHLFCFFFLNRHAASWGVKILQNRQTIFEAATTIFYAIKHKIEYGFDQTLLNDHLWPLAINNHVNLNTRQLHFIFVLMSID